MLSVRVEQSHLIMEWQVYQGEPSKWPKPGRWAGLAGGLQTNAHIRVPKGSDFDRSVYCIFSALTKQDGQIPASVIKALELHPQALWTRELGAITDSPIGAPQHHDDAVDTLCPEVEVTPQERAQKRTRSLRMNARGSHKRDHLTKRQKLDK